MLDDSRPSVTGQLWSPRPGAALDAGAATHGGAHGPNQDRYLVSPPVYAVADGLGGHEAGEVASALVVEALEELSHGVVDPDTLREAVDLAAGRISGLPRGGSGPAPGSTVVAAAYVEQAGVAHWCLLSVGDSRAYLARAGSLSRLTRDHSVVGEQVADGTLTEDAARAHPGRHVLTRALGADLASPVDLDLVEVESDARLLLCSDGIWSVLDDEAIAALLTAAEPAPDTAARLVEAAVAAGGADDATALVLEVSGLEALTHELDEDTVEITAPRSAPVAAPDLTGRLG